MNNLSKLSRKKAVEFIEDAINTKEIENITFLIESEEEKKLFIEDIKLNMNNTSICILDSRRYNLGQRLGIDLSSYENDLRGIPKIVSERTIFPGSIDLPQENLGENNGILIFDNIQDSEEFTQGCIHSLLDTRKILSYELPKGWSIINIVSSLNFKWASKIINNTSMIEVLDNNE